MTSGELTRAIFTANDVALQWYAVTHQTAVPGAPGSVVMTSPPGGGFSATFGSGTLVLAALGLLAVVFIMKS